MAGIELVELGLGRVSVVNSVKSVWRVYGRVSWRVSANWRDRSGSDEWTVSPTFSNKCEEGVSSGVPRVLTPKLLASLRLVFTQQLNYIVLRYDCKRDSGCVPFQ